MKLSLLRFVPAVLLLGTLTACGGGSKWAQTPLQLQEPYVKPDYVASYGEDRVTLKFAKGQTTLDAAQKDLVRRFVDYYKNAKHTAIMVSLVIPPEMEDVGNLPRSRPDVTQQVAATAVEVANNGVRPRLIKEVDSGGQPHVVEARARKAMLDTASGANGEDVAFLMPNPADLMRETRIAVVAREYEVQAANCPKQGYHSWEGASYASDGILVGCSVNGNLLAQVKDHSVFVQGEDMDPEYYSAFSVLQLRKVQDAEYDEVFQKAKEGISGGFKETN